MPKSASPRSPDAAGMIDVALEKRVPGFSLDVAFANEGGITALFGPSGAGKSMALGLIAGLQRPDRGRIVVDGTALVDCDTRLFVPMHRRRIGLVFQDSHLFPHLTVRQNLMFGRWFARGRTTGIAFEPVIETLGIGALLPRRPGTLSGGERQRVAIGRALLAGPRLLLFDEPLAALDRQRRLEILPLIERLRDEFRVPMVYVSHAVEEVARLAAKVIVLERGRVIAAGDPTDVFVKARTTMAGSHKRVSVLEVTVGVRDEAYGLTALDHPAGTLWLAAEAGPAGTRRRALVDATDVTLAIGATGPLSIRSALDGAIAAITTDGARAEVELALDGGGRLVALVTRRAADDLSLDVGTRVRALIKTVALDEAAVIG